MSKLIPCNYTVPELKDALASLAINTTSNEDSNHIHGYHNGDYGKGDTVDGDGDYFTDGHELSMLQTITARRVLDYRALLTKNETPDEVTLLTIKAPEFHKTYGPILNLRTQIKNQQPSMALAAEFKRASPSKGNIAPESLKAEDQALIYTKAGACTISILTEQHYFKGSLDDLTKVRITTTHYANENDNDTTTTTTTRPAILRKDFCISTYMIAEAYAAGADTILLIVAITPKKLLAELIAFCRSIDMEPLVEVHAPIELDVALSCGAKVIGVNNRNLHTFQMDLGVTDRTADELTKRNCGFFHSFTDDNDNDNNKDDTNNNEYAVCALSGMSSANDVERYRQKGVGMCLIGESLMRAADPQKAITSLMLNPTDYQKHHQSSLLSSAYTGGMKIIKVCGITNANDALVACRNGANLIGVIFVPKSKRCVSVDQAKEVVSAVRAFGERSGVISVPSNVVSTSTDGANAGAPPISLSPVQSLVKKSLALEEVSRRPMVVGVFQNQSHEFIREMVQTCGLDLIQLHGKEGMEAANIKDCTVPAIRVVDIETNADGTGKAASDAVETLLSSLTTDPFAILLDTSIKGSKEGGGTGVTFDWSLAEKLQNNGLPVIIAGGLKPSNVKDAVTSVRPWGIDVSSGVEECPGKKDHESVVSFVQGAREAAVEASKGF